MKKIISKIVVTQKTVALAVLTFAIIIINSLWTRRQLTGLVNILNPNQLNSGINSITQSYLWWAILFGVLVSILPLYWAWKNYQIHKKKWFYFAAIAVMLLDLQPFLIIAILAIYIYKMHLDFNKWKIERDKMNERGR